MLSSNFWLLLLLVVPRSSSPAPACGGFEEGRREAACPAWEEAAGRGLLPRVPLPAVYYGDEAEEGGGAAAETETETAVMQCKDGHYRPPNSCFFKHVLVDASGGMRVPLGGGGGGRPKTLEGGSVFDVWNMRRGFAARRGGGGGGDGKDCVVLTGPVVAFTFYYHYGAGNYYHFVYDTLLPLFALLEAQGWLLPASPGEQRVLWPTVEHGSLVGFDEGVDWSTDAFSRRRDDGSLPYWHEALVSIFGAWEVEPLTNATLERRLQRAGLGTWREHGKCHCVRRRSCDE